jgi:hypothetical protein
MRSLVMAGLLATTLAFGAPAAAGAMQAQTTTADQDAEKAKSAGKKAAEETKEAAKKTGSAVKEAGKATVSGTKSVAKTTAKDTKKVAKAVGKDTKGAVKTTGSDAKTVGAAIKEDITGDHKNATARCTDGTFWYAADRAGACKDHGGVAEWMKK